MKPIIYPENATQFNTNGLGRLSDVITGKSHEQRNGMDVIEFAYPMTGARYNEIALRKIVCVKPTARRSIQPYRINKISRPINGIVLVEAEHLGYDLSKNVAMPFEIPASAHACADTLAALKSNAVESCPFTFWTDVNTLSSYKQTTPASIRQRLGGVEGSVLDQFGGEFEWDGYTVKLHKNRGSAKDITLRYGKNITDIKQEENISDTVTGIVPFWTDSEGGNVVTLLEKAIYSQYASHYANPLTVEMDFSSDFQEQPTQAQLRAHAQAYVNQTDFGKPKVSIDVSFINLADTEEYKDIAPLEEADLCDIINVQFTALGINTTAKIVEVEYDWLNEKYISMTVGTLRANLSYTIQSSEKAITNQIASKFGQAATETRDAITNATNWLTSPSGSVYQARDTDGTWVETYYLDRKGLEDAQNLLRINSNGIGFSHTGIDGPYISAWLIDGTFNADFILAGTLTANLIRAGILQGRRGECWWNLENGDFQLTPNVIMLNTDATYAGAYTPTASNYPASSWTTESAKASHVGETFYDSVNKRKYVYKKTRDGVRISFSRECSTERNYDYVEVYYMNGSTVYKYDTKLTGGRQNSQNDIANAEIFIPVDTFYLYWKSDSSVTDYGYKVDAVTYDDDVEVTGFSVSSLPSGIIAVTTSDLPESDHPYGNNEEELYEVQTGITLSGNIYRWVDADETIDDYIDAAIDDYDSDLDQEAVFNKLTNNGSLQGLYMQNGDLYINATYIAAGILKDVGGNTQFNLTNGKLDIGKGSINLGNNFIVDSSGNLNAKAATINGETKSIGSNSWVDINDGEVKGGRGTVINQNTTKIKFDQLVNGNPGSLSVDANYFDIITNGILVHQSRNDSAGYEGYTGNIVQDIDSVSVSSTTGTLRNICTNLREVGDHLEWNNVDFTYIASITVTVTPDYISTLHGIVLAEEDVDEETIEG